MYRRALTAAAVLAVVSPFAFAGGTPNGPDVIVSTVGSGWSRYGSIDVNPDPLITDYVTGYAFTTVSCNLGEADAIWIDCTNGLPQCNQHPVIGMELYRLKDGRFEQIGISWLKHGFCAADAPSCGSPYEPHGSCDWLGTHATDTYGSSLNGSQSGLGPRSEINPWTGVYPYPYVLNWGQTGNAIFKRLQIREADLNPALNPGAMYFGESQYICTDEQAINRYNNVSYRPVVVGTYAGVGGGYNLAFTGVTIQQQAAIHAWQAADPSVTLVNVDVPSDGRFIIGYKVTDNGDGQTWTYEYAVYNMNVARAARTFSLPVSDLVAVTDVGFRDVPYHSGEPFSGADWGSSHAGGALTWSTETHALNPNANAIRWSTLYNFRFTSDQPPVAGTATIGLFRPGSPDSVTADVLVPDAPPTCAGDISGDGYTDTTDLNVILSDFGCTGGGCAGDISGDGYTDTTDLNVILSDFGCGL